MRHLIIFLFISSLFSCKQPPYFTKKKIRNVGNQHNFASLEDFDVSRFHFSAAQRRPFFHVVDDTLTVVFDINNKLETVLRNHSFSATSLQKDSILDPLIQPKLRWKRRAILRFLEDQDYQEPTLIPILCYNVSFGSEKSAGGGIEFVQNTGNDRYNIAQELYIAVYHSNQLVYLNKVVRWDQKIVPAGTPITHEFPQHVLDTLMQMALEPLLEQMEKNASKHQKP